MLQNDEDVEEIRLLSQTFDVAQPQSKSATSRCFHIPGYYRSQQPFGMKFKVDEREIVSSVS